MRPITKINDVTHRPTPQQYKRRRIAAACLAALLVVVAISIGVTAQRTTGWSTADLEKQLVAAEPESNTKSNEAVPRMPEDEKPDIAPVARTSHGQGTILDAPAPGHSARIWVTTGGERRAAYVQVPKAAADGEPTPLVMAFHGYEETPTSMAEYSGLGAAWGKDGGDGAIVVYPEGKGKAWEGAPYSKTSNGQDQQFVRDLLDRLSATYSVDATRIYAAGMSNGGGLGLKLACDMPHQFSAIASVAGAYYPGTWKGCATRQSDPAKPDSVRFVKAPTTPFLEIHGRKDETIEYRGGTRHGSPYLAPMRVASLYAGRSGCFGAPRVVTVTSKVNRVEWPSCANNSEVMHISIADAAHTWPGEMKGSSGAGEVRRGEGGESNRTNDTITATNEVLAFFERHRGLTM